MLQLRLLVPGWPHVWDPILQNSGELVKGLLQEEVLAGQNNAPQVCQCQHGGDLREFQMPNRGAQGSVLHACSSPLHSPPRIPNGVTCPSCGGPSKAGVLALAQVTSAQWTGFHTEPVLAHWGLLGAGSYGARHMSLSFSWLHDSPPCKSAAKPLPTSWDPGGTHGLPRWGACRSLLPCTPTFLSQHPVPEG